MNELELIKLIEEEKKKVKTKSLDISFNELLDMNRDEEIVIGPEYQRMFRWSIEDQSRFIESVILELPIPPIFVIEVDNGIYELIDGLQRVTSYIRFRNGELVLEGCEIAKQLNGLTFEKLPRSVQVKLKRHFVRMEVIEDGSERELRYHMFKRLNRGGEILSEQEVRNCTIRILDSKLINLINSLADNDNFKSITSNLSKEAVEKMVDKEHILRFFAFKNNVDNYNDKLPDFLTNYMEGIAEERIDFNYEEETNNFKKLFKVLDKLGGKNLFATELKNGTIKENLILYYYDSFTLGISDTLDKINEKNIEIVKKELKKLKESSDLYRRRTGSKSNVREKRRIVREAIEAVI